MAFRTAILEQCRTQVSSSHALDSSIDLVLVETTFIRFGTYLKTTHAANIVSVNSAPSELGLELLDDGITSLGSGFFLKERELRGVVPRQEIIDPVDWMIGDAGEHNARPSLGSTSLRLAVTISD